MKKMKTSFLSLIGFLILSFIINDCDTGNKNKKPNLLHILVDDIGYTDIGAFATHLLGLRSHSCKLNDWKNEHHMGMWDAYGFVKTTFEKTGKRIGA
jgi:hypothetical protein